MAESFLYVLAVGLALFFVAFLVSGVNIPTERGAITTTNIIFSDTIGQLGLVTQNVRHIPLGDFVVGNVLTETVVKDEPYLEIKKGLFSESSKILDFDAEDMVNVYVDFSVEETNKYGNLQLILNNNLVKTIDDAGGYKIELTNYNNSNILKISAESSGLKFWAPTTYIINDFKIIVEGYGDQKKIIPFTIKQHESEGWSLGRLWFTVDEAETAGDLIATINGNEVYSGVPSLTLVNKKDFAKETTQIKPGENIAIFRAEEDTSYSLKNTELIIFYYGTGEYVSVIKEFEIKSTPFYELENKNATGQIRFYVEESSMDRGITLELNNESSSWTSLKEGEWYSMNFTGADVQRKDNVLKFSTSGSYKIGESEISFIEAEEESIWGRLW